MNHERLSISRLLRCFCLRSPVARPWLWHMTCVLLLKRHPAPYPLKAALYYALFKTTANFDAFCESRPLKPCALRKLELGASSRWPVEKDIQTGTICFNVVYTSVQNLSGHYTGWGEERSVKCAIFCVFDIAWEKTWLDSSGKLPVTTSSCSNSSS